MKKSKTATKRRGPTAEDYKEPSEAPQRPGSEPPPAPEKTWPRHEDIALKAYYIYLSQGNPDGRDLEHWLFAEAELKMPSRK